MKSREEAKANFENAISYIPARFEAGVRRADWATPAGSDAAEKNYGAGVSKAVANKTRQKAVRTVSNAQWQDDTVKKGAPVIGDRIRMALDDWEATWGPMYDTVKAKVGTLAPHTIDWRANINNRLIPVVEQWKKAAGKT